MAQPFLSKASEHHLLLRQPIWLFESVVFLFFGHTMQHMVLSSLTRDRTCAPLQWKDGVLTTGPSGRSPHLALLYYIDFIL